MDQSLRNACERAPPAQPGMTRPREPDPVYAPHTLTDQPLTFVQRLGRDVIPRAADLSA